MDRKKILLIDDEHVWLGLLRKFFRYYGYDVVGASSCAEGLQMLKLHQPDCIILDFNLKDGDANVICAEVRGNSGIPHTPIIIFTGDPAAKACLTGGHRADKMQLKNEPLANLLSLVGGLTGT